MEAIGIVAEYNPLHRGHIYHIERSRDMAGRGCPVVCVMSGSVTQRGEPACMDKWTRARAAVEHGADLVIELPAPYACASADKFAWGAVFLLNATGVVKTLSFGSECGDLTALERAFDAVEALDVKALMSGGASYPKALSRADNAVLSGANNTLGICYLRALKMLVSDITPITVKREGAGHDETAGDKGFPSAKELRELMFAGENAEHLCGGGEPVSLYAHERLVLSALRSMEPEHWSEIEEVGEGLEYRLNRAVRNAKSLDGLYALVKTRRYTMARIRRIILRAYLGIPRAAAPPPYLRVLAFGTRGAELLKRMKKTATIPIITKPASYRDLSPDCRELFELECGITDRMSLHRAEIDSMGRELRESPVRVE